MTRSHWALASFAGFAISLGSVATVCAASSRTYVSVAGSDANPCSVALPCRSLQAAANLTEPGGEIHVANSGDYGAVSITKSITITSEGAVAGISAQSGAAIIISAGANDLINLRGLEIDGGNSGSVGIQFNSGQALSIQKTVVRGFANSAIAFSPNGSATLFISDTTVQNNRGNGIAIVASGQAGVGATLSKVNVSGNGAGIYAIGASVSLTVTDSLATNGSYGIAVNGATALIRNSTINSNAVGVFADQGGIVRLGQSFVTGNGTGIAFSGGGQVQSFGNNSVAGNGKDGAMSTSIALK